jgi:site-specific recombinase XerD
VACSKPEVKIPNNVIPKDSMVFIMMDVHIAEAGVKSLSADSLMINTKTYYEFIYKKHQITEEQFQKSMRFYTYQPELLQEIYVKMTEEILANKKKSKLKI